MSAGTVQDMARAPAVRPRGAWRRIIPAVGMAFAVIVFVASVDVLLGPVVAQVHITIPPDAVQVSASAAVGGRTLVSREITDAHTVAALYRRINALPSVKGPRYSCMLATPDMVTYMFHFTRRGFRVEDANPDGAGCYPRRWVVTSPFAVGWDLHMDFTGKQTNAILAEAHLPPLPS